MQQTNNQTNIMNKQTKNTGIDDMKMLLTMQTLTREMQKLVNGEMYMHLNVGWFYRC